jgi:hypothetical protein
MTRIKAPVEDLKVGDVIELDLFVHPVQSTIRDDKRRTMTLRFWTNDSDPYDVRDEVFGFGATLTQIIEVAS